MLLLFDIDGTLLLTSGAGMAAMKDAAKDICGPSFTFDGVKFAGRLDPLIWRDAAERNGVENHEELHADFRAAYGAHIKHRLETSATAHSLPGVDELLKRCAELEGATVGLVTGNYPETGRLKLRAAGIDPDQFAIAGWGTDGAVRNDLPAAAIRQYAEVNDGHIDPRRVIVIGDTPHDVACAHANGCLALAVCTGPSYEREDLEACGADWVVEDLSDVESVISWMQDAVKPAAKR
jgi:phosphoglycolate phosphatase-like HAD superfamily hydrolase